ncbi:MAG: 16S rRNA (uracil(1498)-N(3))-methyltransferase [Actinomycetales bacterium]|jgi:16S rRNA (uracil1498-N3)-methyltransferase
MLQLFIVENIPDRGDVVIEGDEAHHVGVARIKVGERVSVTNGSGRRAEVEVLDINKRNVGCRILEVTDEPRPKTILTIVQALTKGDRARETIELLTEGGAEIIIPWQAANSIGQWKEEKDALTKWKSWAKEATKQSRRSWIPQILDLHSTAQLKTRIQDSEFTVVFHEASPNKLSEILVGTPPKEITLIIGPEGGVTEDELAGFISAGAQSALLGQPVFRSAHAGVAALSAVQTGFKIW